MKPPYIHPIAIESLKKMLRGLLGEIMSDCRLVFDCTSTCDSIGIFSASRTALRYPARSPYARFTDPSASFASNFATGSFAGRK